MYARGTEWMLRCAALFALVLLAAPAWAQWDARPPGRLAALTSGPVAVSMVATLQSLSVSALPASFPISAAEARQDPALTVRTAWTIRANCTTLRLSGYQRGAADQGFGRDPIFAGNAGVTGAPTPSPAETVLYENGSDFSGIAQPVGPTNYPGSRTDNIEFDIEGDGFSPPAAASSPVYIVAQAL